MSCKLQVWGKRANKPPGQQTNKTPDQQKTIGFYPREGRYMVVVVVVVVAAVTNIMLYDIYVQNAY